VVAPLNLTLTFVCSVLAHPSAILCRQSCIRGLLSHLRGCRLVLIVLLVRMDAPSLVTRIHVPLRAILAEGLFVVCWLTLDSHRYFCSSCAQFSNACGIGSGFWTSGPCLYAPTNTPCQTNSSANGYCTATGTCVACNSTSCPYQVRNLSLHSQH
jgi:hypothetical protein